MDREQIAALLAGARESHISGEEMSRALGVTRAAVWKEIDTLRKEGWPIQSSTRKGYRLAGPPPVLSAAYISARLAPDSMFRGQVRVESIVDSTNTRLKAEAASLPAGSALIAEEQTGGRGTHGRSFQSPKGDGLYLSVLLRPKAALADLFTLTGWVAVAARDGAAKASGAPVEIKWLNDLYLHGRKLCGILTELSFLGESAEPDYVVVGMGVNMSQTAETFRAQGLEHIAASLAGEGFPVERNHLAVCLLDALDQMVRDFPDQRKDYLERYRAHCITLGRRVSFEVEGGTLTGTVSGVDGQFGLRVAGDDGTEYTVSSGTVKML
ncbi:MAG: biotin--[acetyl-CoA-carboxylase] ligase [Oscillospiraceae bacterium]|nr:biotin--[acetyl-CoA-carboxylase] ligase [Oscillospiraceae bacterium]